MPNPPESPGGGRDDKNRKVYVCAACRHESCWRGEFMCDKARASSIKTPGGRWQRVLIVEPPEAKP